MFRVLKKWNEQKNSSLRSTRRSPRLISLIARNTRKILRGFFSLKRISLVEKYNMANLRQTLYAWRDHEAAKRAVELFRVLPNSALDEIVKTLPRTKEELTAIKGIKDEKYREYGKAILTIIDEHIPTLAAPKITTEEESELTSIGKVL